MQEKISIQEYIAYNNKPLAQKMLVKYGLRPAKSPIELERKLVSLTRDYKEEALRELANIHPDKDLILNFADRPELKSNKQSSFCGCSSGFDGEESSSFCGCSGFDGSKTETKLTESKPTENLPAKNNLLSGENLGIILITGLVAITIVALSKK
jgi:hypothetical protein